VRIGVVKRGCLAPQTWLLKMFKTLRAFPEGKHDDQVVALGLVGQLIARGNCGRFLFQRNWTSVVSP
jgi:hypothetical protein